MKHKGFTLIELLVVVAIIGILATVVLASLGSARSKATDSKIKATLSQARAQAEVQYNGDYNSICDESSQSGTMFRDVVPDGVYESGDYATCVDSNNIVYSSNGSTYTDTAHTNTTGSQGATWGMEVPLSTGEYFCVDSTGTAEITTARSISTNPANQRKC